MWGGGQARSRTEGDGAMVCAPKKWPRSVSLSVNCRVPLSNLGAGEGDRGSVLLGSSAVLRHAFGGGGGVTQKSPVHGRCCSQHLAFTREKQWMYGHGRKGVTSKCGPCRLFVSTKTNNNTLSGCGGKPPPPPPRSQWCCSRLTVRTGECRYEPIFPDPEMGELAWCVTHIQMVFLL